jgi:hypothetical protein
VRTGKETADLYAPVEKHFQERSTELQIPPLRYAPVGMTKEKVALPFKLDAAEDEQQVPPLRCAPVGMTLLVWGSNIPIPKRSVIPTGAQRSGGTCCFSLGFSRRHFSPTLFFAPVEKSRWRLYQGVIPLPRTQKLSVHFWPAGNICSSAYLPRRAKFTPSIMAAKGSKQMNSWVRLGEGGR